MIWNWGRFFSSKASAKVLEVVVGDGRKITCKTGHMARLADGSSLLQTGDTAVLATVVGKASTSLQNRGFVPLTVEFRQRAAAAGRIPMNFLRREMAHSVSEVLQARLVDRAIRPLFSSAIPIETQVVCTLLSADAENDADVLAVNAASLALGMSDIPFALSGNLVGAVRVGCINGSFVANPTRSEQRQSSVNLLVAANSFGNIIMLEGSAKELGLIEFTTAISFGSKEASKVAKALLQLCSTAGKPKRMFSAPNQPDKQLMDAVYSLSAIKLKEIFLNFSHDKLSRDAAVSLLREEVLNNFLSANSQSITPSASSLFYDAFSQSVKRVFRRQIIEKKIRCDGRGVDDLRPLSCDVDLFAPLHGSAIFQRGQSQVFATVTFDSQEAAFRPDPAAALLMGLREKNFMLHYEFPAFATSELGRPGAVSRREIGHGALAERSLIPAIPDNYPFTIRVTTEVLESNGSTSMGAVCAGSLALMDAGVPLCNFKEGRTDPVHVAGVAIGLITADDVDSGATKYVLLTDQIGIEDYMGDMDFKIAGTVRGITGIQADTKLPEGLPLELAIESVYRGSSAIARTIDVMVKALPKPRSERKPWAPTSDRFVIPPSRRSQVVGLGGYNLRRLCSETGVTLTPVDDSTYEVFAPNPRSMADAKERFADLVALNETVGNDLQLDFGAVYRVRILEIRDYGVLVEFPKRIAPNLSPVLLHNSQLDSRRVAHPSVLGLTVGQEISVKYFGRDPATGNIRLSRKVLFVGSSPSADLVELYKCLILTNKKMELAQIDMIYSLLSMLNTDDKEHISRTLLGMSTCRDSCIAMRQAGCMSLLVQLIHGCPDNSRNSTGYGSRVARQRAAAALHNLVHCLPDEKWRRREARVLRLLEIVREYSDNQQQRITSSNNSLAQSHAPVDSSRVGPAVAALMKLSFDEDHRHAITVLGGLQAVSELIVVDLEMFPIITGTAPSALSMNIRRFGSMTLTNLTFGDVTNKALLCSMPTTLKAVVSLLGFLDNEDIVQAAGSVLRNLSWSADPPSKVALRDAGAVRQLVRSVMAVKRESTRTAVFSALWNVSAHLSENKADICSAEGALDFVAFSLTSPGSIGESAGGVLRNISSHIAVNSEYRQILRRRGCLEVLVNQLKSSNLTTVSNACGALWNLSAKCPEDQQTLWELGAVHNLQTLSSSKHQMIATAAAAAIRNLLAYKQQYQNISTGLEQQNHFPKQSMNKTSGDSSDGPPLSSSFPGTGTSRQIQSQSNTATVSSSAYMTGQSPFASIADKSTASNNIKSQQNTVAVLGMLGANNINPIGAVAAEGKGAAGKNSILYSDTPNSNVVHLNYLHMLATRTGQPLPQVQHLPAKLATDALVSKSPQPATQRPLSARLPNAPNSFISPSPVGGRHACVPTGNIGSETSLGGISMGKAPDVCVDDTEEDDEQPTNFGQRFQESEVQERCQKLSFPGDSTVAPGTKSSSSPTGSSGSSRSHNNENKMITRLDSRSVPTTSISQKSPNNKAAPIIRSNQQLPAGHVTFAPHVAVEAVEQTPMMFSRRSSVDSLNSVDVPSIRSEAVSEYSRLASGAISPTDLPESPGAMVGEQDHIQSRQALPNAVNTGFRIPTSAFATAMNNPKPKLLTSNSAPLASAEDSFPAVDSYADEAERPIVYATEDTPAILSHATSLSNLTTPGFETPGGTFSPVRGIVGDQPVSPPTAAAMRLYFRKPVEPELVEDEVVPYYTEDTPCHLSASSSLSSLSVMSRASSHRSATGTPLRQKILALQSGMTGAITNAGVFGGTPGTTLLHPRVVAAASRSSDPFMRHSPFIAPTSAIGSPFVVSSPQAVHSRRPAAVLLEESEDSHNISGLSNENNDGKELTDGDDAEAHAFSDSDHSVASSLSAEEEEEILSTAHNAVAGSREGNVNTIHQHSIMMNDAGDVGEESAESETEDLIQQLIETALESPKTNDKLNDSNVVVAKLQQRMTSQAISNQLERTTPISNFDGEDGNVCDGLTPVDADSRPEINGDLESEPTAKELELLEECINLAITPGASKSTEGGNEKTDPSERQTNDSTETKQATVKMTDCGSFTSVVSATINNNPMSHKTQRSSLTVVSGSQKLRSPHKVTGIGGSIDAVADSPHHHHVKGVAGNRGKSGSRLASVETSPSDIGRSSSPGSVSRGGSSSGGGSTTKQIGSKKVQQITVSKRSPVASIAGGISVSTKRLTQPRRSRSRGEGEVATTPNLGSSATPGSASKVSPSSSSNASAHNPSGINKPLSCGTTGSSNISAANSKRWNFSTKPTHPSCDTQQPVGKSCCKHHVDRQQSATDQNQSDQQSHSRLVNVWQRPQQQQQQQQQQPLIHNKKVSPSPTISSGVSVENSADILQQCATNQTAQPGLELPTGQPGASSTETSGGKNARRVLMTTV